MASNIVFTNGCFDVLHRGHVELLKYCKDLGGKVIVGINSDESVRRLKGESRPIVNQLDRKFILEAIQFVDQVIIFDEDTPYNLMKSINPDVIVKGGDYNKKDVVGNDLCQVRIFKYVPGYSTTKTIQNIANR
jgi:D-beta-D-heptose 7-phosphate kinase/D-beta-D-heptose 1-phosphate adenosyltransferase